MTTTTTSSVGIPVFHTPCANANTVKELILCTLLLTTVATPGQKGDNGNHNVQKRQGRNKEQHHGASSILLERSATRIFIVIESGRDRLRFELVRASLEEMSSLKIRRSSKPFHI
jgi:hypothetical protein